MFLIILWTVGYILINHANQDGSTYDILSGFDLTCINKSAEILVHCFITYRVDINDCLLLGLQDYLMHKLHLLQNAAACLLLKLQKPLPHHRNIKGLALAPSKSNSKPSR